MADSTPPIIGYQNIITETNVSGSVSRVGFPVSALANPLTADPYRVDLADIEINIDAGVATSVDYFALAAHNLHLFGGTLSLYGNSVAGLTGSPTLIGSVAIGETGIPVGLISATTQSFRYYTLQYLPDTLSDADADYIEIGSVFLGEIMRFERCIRGAYTPPQYNRQTDKTSQRTEGGQFLGTTIRRLGLEGSLSFQYGSANWCRSTYQAFVLHARTKPYFLWWNYGKYPEELAYCQTEADITWEYTGEASFASSSFSFEALGYDE